MKKNRILVIIIFLLLCFIGGILYTYNLYKNRTLAGEKIVDGLYLYNIDIGDNIHSIKIINGNIYYWIEKNNKYEINKIDIYTNKVKLLGTVEGNDTYCYVESEYIICSNSEKKTIYNYKFKKIYEGEPGEIIPYKNTYYKIVDNTIYYKDKELQKFDVGADDCNVYDYIAFDDNIYLFFSNYNGDGCIYNLKENKCENFKYIGVKQYADGLYNFNKEKINVINFKTNETKEYNNPVSDEYLTFGQLDNNLLYYFSEDYFKIYNLENDKVKLLDYRINEYASEIVLKDNLIYLVVDKKVYIINLDEISTIEMTKDELSKLFDEKINDRIKKIKDDYGVEIKIKKDADLKFTSFKETITGERNNEILNDSLDYTEEVLSMFGKEFFNEFKHGEYKGLRIYMANNIKSSFAMAGEEFRYYDYYAIIADQSDYKRTLCHELMHALEDAVDTKGKNMFSKWFSYNPKRFNYGWKYDSFAPARKYTPGYDKSDVYFVDNYSQVNDLEDRARIFENLCMDTTDVIKDNPYLLKKAQYQVKEIKRFYPMIKDIHILNSLD